MTELITPEARAAVNAYKIQQVAESAALTAAMSRPTPAVGANSPNAEVRPVAVSQGDHFNQNNFDPEAVVADIKRRPLRDSYVSSDRDEPTGPMLPPAGVDIPDELRAAMAKHDAAYDAWRDAVEARDDYQDEAGASRNKRAAAIRAAGIAAAQGKPRPKIPAAISEADEAVEVAVLSHVIASRRREASKAAEDVTALTLWHAHRWVDTIADGFAPSIDEARAAVSAAIQAVEKAEGVLSQAARLRGFAHMIRVTDAGGRVSARDVPLLVGAYSDAMVSEGHRMAEAHQRSPLPLLARTRAALDDLAACDLAAKPHPDTTWRVDSTAQRVTSGPVTFTSGPADPFENSHDGTV
ncbi:hypothetical protein [Micromonospora sp. NPDC005299]|uniref:hypothetical protein n=1 Tax=Micromonospora sp. NPDC005299 TaxID=3364231 RepID=UPI0036BFAAE5